MKHTIVSEHIELFRYGAPRNTGAICQTVTEPLTESSGNIPGFKVTSSSNEGLILSRAIEPFEKFYGLGSKIAPINRRGKEYRFFASEPPSQIPPVRTSYGSVPFLICVGTETYGIFIDSGTELFIDIGGKNQEALTIRTTTLDFDIWILKGAHPTEIIQNFLTLTGAPYLPPKWAFGYHQSRWSYGNEQEVRAIADSLATHDIPCDAIHLDIDYMQQFKVFTIDENKFPNLPKLSSDLNSQGIKLISIVDPGVKIEPGYKIYEEGLRKNYFCKYRNGKDFAGAVWPGMCHFPDFLRPEVQQWWGGLYKRLIDQGIVGFWNDMNEPTIFFSADSLKSFRNKFNSAQNLDSSGAELARLVFQRNPLSFREVGYANMFHHDHGDLIPHTEIHNLYGTLMTKATHDALQVFAPGKRHFLLSRSHYVGMHRYATVWMGDNSSWWEHLLLHIRMLLSLNMAGFFFTGADVGGFWHDATGELVARWTALGALTPFFRNHSSEGTVPQEPWAFGTQILIPVRSLIKLRYRLIPWLYSIFLESQEKLIPPYRPLAFDFSDQASAEIEDQFMLGASTLFAPIIAPNVQGREVYLPRDARWLVGCIDEHMNSSLAVVEGGHHRIEAELHQIPFAIRENGCIALAAPQKFVDQTPITELELVGFVSTKLTYRLLNDDGESEEYKKGLVSELLIDIVRDSSSPDGYSLHIESSLLGPRTKRARLETPKIPTLHFRLFDEEGKVHIFSRTGD